MSRRKTQAPQTPKSQPDNYDLNDLVRRVRSMPLDDRNDAVKALQLPEDSAGDEGGDVVEINAGAMVVKAYHTLDELMSHDDPFVRIEASATFIQLMQDSGE